MLNVSLTGARKYEIGNRPGCQNLFDLDTKRWCRRRRTVYNKFPISLYEVRPGQTVFKVISTTRITACRLVRAA